MNLKEKGHILIAEDDDLSRELLQDMLSVQGFRVTAARDGQEALDLLSEHHDLILTDLRMPRLDGIGLLKALRERAPRPAVIVMSAYATIESAVEATKEGAYGYIVKPIRRDSLLHLIQQALKEQRLQHENELLRRELERSYRFHDLIGKSPKMRELFHLLEGVAESESTILIQGESGTGKELVARAIHAMSPRKERPFVALNCGGLTETLLESELFGHVKGAFTGAIAEKKGLFQAAHGGTLFLDEIGDMRLDLQAKLLRAIQEGEIERVGGSKAIQINARLIAATNKNLEQAVRREEFREDLYWRLNVIPIHLPPLRERRQDIPHFVQLFLERYSQKFAKKINKISDPALKILCEYDWPGNIRELEHLVERLVAISDGPNILEGHIPIEYYFRGSDFQTIEEAEGDLLRKASETFERNFILKVMEKANWNRRLAAERLGLPLSTLKYKLSKLDLYELLCELDPSKGRG